MADFDPLRDPPLSEGERVRIVRAYRCGSDLRAWERRLAGRSGTVAEVFERDGSYAQLIIAVRLDPLTPRQRTVHVAQLTLRYMDWPEGVDVVTREVNRG